MIEFIKQNKEWLFSGAGVAVIGILATWLRSKKTKDNTQPNVVIHVHGDENLPEVSEQPVTPTPIEKISPLTFEKVKSAIDSAPPLQRDDVKKNYEGITVEWDTYLKNAQKKENGLVWLSLTTDKKYGSTTVFCEVLLSEYKELGILPAQTKIRIHGEIAEANSWDISLKNVRLFFYS